MWIYDATKHVADFLNDTSAITKAITAVSPIFAALAIFHKKVIRGLRGLCQWIIKVIPNPDGLESTSSAPLGEQTLSLPSGDTYSVYIPQDQDARLNEKKFFDYFSERLRGAKFSIFNSGDGFNMRRPKSEYEFASSAEKADMLDEAIITAMRERGVRYYRFQILGNACSISWLSRLIWMKMEFDDQFQLYFNPHFDHMGCFCAIDPSEPDCMFEWQLVTRRNQLEGTFSRGYGFLSGVSAICREIQQLFRDISTASGTYRPNNTDEIIKELRSLQERFWNDRVSAACFDPHYELSVEITQVMEKRQLTRDKITRENMAFSADDFLPIRCPTPANLRPR